MFRTLRGLATRSASRTSVERKGAQRLLAGNLLLRAREPYATQGAPAWGGLLMGTQDRKVPWPSAGHEKMTKADLSFYNPPHSHIMFSSPLQPAAMNSLQETWGL